MMFDYIKKRIGFDGLLHIVVSATLMAVLALFIPTAVAAGFVFVCGVLKEIVWDDVMGNGTADWKDVACDAFGVFIGIL